MRQSRGVMVHGFAAENPSHVRPPFSIERSVGIAFLIRFLMVNAVRSDPEDRTTLKRQGCTCSQYVLNPFWRPISAVREQAVIAHADSQAAGNPPQECRN